MSFTPTESQSKVLLSKNKNIAVSASAGSGKTTLMIEKVLSILENENADISKFLICTFTKNAGDEIKERLYEKLANKIKEETDEKERTRLINNYEKIELAKINTIDKICLDLAKKYFYKLKIAPNIEILSNFQKENLKNKAFTLTLGKIESKDKSMVDLLCNYFLQDREISKFKEFVYRLYDDMQTRADGNKFLDNGALSLYECDIKTSDMVLKPLSVLDDKMQALLTLYEATIDKIDDKFKKFKERLDGDILILKSYFNLDIESKIKYIFELSIFSNFYANNCEYSKELTLAKNSLRDYVSELKKYFDTYDLNILAFRINETKKMLEKLIIFLKEFKSCYDDLKIKQNQYDFVDIQHLALEILKDEKTLTDCIKDIDYIFIDEYQDVNYLQEELIDTLVKSDNLFLVGDAKQSIYGFRLCTPIILLNKMRKFANEDNSICVNLNENFRSDKVILEFVNQIFSNVMTLSESGVDYKTTDKLSGALSFNNENLEHKVKVDIILEPSKSADEDTKQKDFHVYNISDEEEYGVDFVEVEANHIVKLVLKCLEEKIFDSKLNGVRNVNYKDIAILFRNRKELYVKVVQKLDECGIPLDVSYKQDLYDSVEVIFINSLLKLVMDSNDDISLATVLSFPCVGLTDNELAKIRLQYLDEQYFSSAVKLYMQQCKDETSDKLCKFFQFLNDIKKKIYTNCVYDLVKEIEFKFKFKNMLYSLNNLKIISNYEMFLNELKDMGNISLVDYLEYLSTRSEVLSEINLSGGENSVSCQTIHSSKGLEYPIVIVVGCGEEIKSRPYDLIVADEGIGSDYYDIENKWKCTTLCKNYIVAGKKKNEIEEEKRLLYVALTRAKNQLIVVGSIKESSFTKNFRDKKEPNYMDFVLSALKDVEKSALTGKKIFNGEFATFEIIENYNSVDLIENEPLEIELNEEKAVEILEFLNYKYEYMENSKIAYKNSVSSILAQFSENQNFTESPKKLEVSEHNVVFKANEIGTIYHKIMENVDFTIKYDLSMVNHLLQNLKSEINVEMVNENEILNCINIVSQFVNWGDEIRKEQPFIFKEKHNKIIDSNCEDYVLVQGVIDLLIKKQNGEIIIIDYKNTSIIDDEKLKEKYYKQLYLYKYATSIVYNTNNIKTYLYSIKQHKLIEVLC